MPPKKRASTATNTPAAKKRAPAAKKAANKAAVVVLDDSDKENNVEDDFSDEDDFSNYDIPYFMDDYINRMMRTESMNILPQNKYNMDEIKYQRQKSYITNYECVSASGKILKPLVVFKNDKVEEEWIKENMPDADKYVFFYNEAKLNTSKLLVKWFKEVFLPQAKPTNEKGEEDVNEWRLLIWDDVSLHSEYDDVARMCGQHKIKLLSVPQEISHFTTPIECFFTPAIKKSLSAQYKTTEVAEDEGYAHKWLKMIHKARMEAMAEKEMEFAWLDTGLEPLNATKVYYLNHERVPRKIYRWVIGAA